jgi:CubicO group peptidase (beta-lactamase class C family)
MHPLFAASKLMAEVNIQTLTDAVRYAVALVACLIPATFFTVGAHAQEVSTRGAELDEYMMRLVPAGFSGTVLVADSTGIVLHKGYGWADIITQRPVDTTTVFSIGSLTKQFTAAGILLLESEGKLSLQDTISQFFSDAPVDKKAITIHHLLSHTSGLRFGVLPNDANLPREEVVGRILNSNMNSKPGSRYGYSNAGYKLLAAIIETASGRTYREFLRSSFFEPLGMLSTGFTQDTPTETGRIATGYNEWKILGSWTSWSSGWLDGSGNIVSTAGDLHRWIESQKAGTLLDHDSIQKLFSPHAAISVSMAYGYGWYIAETGSGERVALHGGDVQGYHCEMRWNMQNDLLIIILTNFDLYDESGVGLGLHKRVLASNLRKLMFGNDVHLPPAAATIAVPEIIYGSYALPDGSVFHLQEFGPYMSIGCKGQGTIDLVAVLADSTRRQIEGRNAKSDRIIRALAAEDSALLAAAVSQDERFFLSFWPEEWSQFTQEFGPYVSHEVYGTYPLPWDNQMSRTYVRLVFEDKSMDYQFTWSGMTLYETIWDAGKPYPLIYNVIPLSPTEFAVYDMVSQREARFTWSPASNGQTAQISFPDGTTATSVVRRE